MVSLEARGGLVDLHVRLDTAFSAGEFTAVRPRRGRSVLAVPHR
jgi:hypothetical protein